jgi:hypothetical protein
MAATTDACGLKRCGWIVIKTDPPERKDFRTGPGETLDKNTSEEFVRRVIATIQSAEPTGTFEERDPELPPCPDDCICRPTRKRPKKDEDFGEPWDQPVIVKVPATGEVGSTEVEVTGHVKKRMAELPGRCYRAVSKPSQYFISHGALDITIRSDRPVSEGQLARLTESIRRTPAE